MRKLKSVNRRNANLEAEKGEVAITSLFGISIPESYLIGGKKHSEGGTPLSLPDGSFIYSNDKSLTIKDPEILGFFGEKKPKTPAAIALKYDMSKYKESFLNDDNPIKKNTAALMIQNNLYMLGKLALVQESMKGFPDGIPSIARYYMEKAGISEDDIYNSVREQGRPKEGKYQTGGGLDHQEYISDDQITEEERRRIEGLVPSDFGIGYENYVSPESVITEEERKNVENLIPSDYISDEERNIVDTYVPEDSSTTVFYPGRRPRFTLRGLGARIKEGARTVNDFLFDKEAYRDRKLRRLVGETPDGNTLKTEHKDYISENQESAAGSKDENKSDVNRKLTLPVVNINLSPFGGSPYITSMYADIARNTDLNKFKYKYLYPSLDFIYTKRPLYRGDYIPSGSLYGHFGDIYRSGYGYLGSPFLLRREEGGSVDKKVISDAFKSAILNMASSQGRTIDNKYSIHDLADILWGNLDIFMNHVRNYLKSNVKDYDKIKDDYDRYMSSRLGYNIKGDKSIQNPEEGRSDVDLLEHIRSVITGENVAGDEELSKGIQDAILWSDVTSMMSLFNEIGRDEDETDIDKAYIRIGDGEPVEISKDDAKEIANILERIHNSFSTAGENEKTNELIDELNKKIYALASGVKDVDIKEYFGKLPGASFSKLFTIEADVNEEGGKKRHVLYEGSGLSRRDALVGSITLGNRFADIPGRKWLDLKDRSGSASGDGSGEKIGSKGDKSGMATGIDGSASYLGKGNDAVAGKTEENKGSEEFKIPEFKKPEEKAPYHWAVQDVNNLLYSLYALNSIKKYYPFEYVPEYQIPTPRYYDPTRALQNVQQSSSDYAKTISSARSIDPQVLAANLAAVQKDVASKSSDIVSQYDDRNRSVASEYERTAANLANDYNMRRALSAQSLYDKTVKTETEYDKERRAAIRNIIAAENQGIKNAADIYNLNNYVYADSPFYVDSFGIMRTADNWVPLKPAPKGSEGSGFLKAAKDYDEAIKFFVNKGYSNEEAKKLAKDIMGFYTYGNKGSNSKRSENTEAVGDSYNYDAEGMVERYREIMSNNSEGSGSGGKRLGGQTMVDSYINKMLRDVKDYLKDPINRKHKNLFRKKKE